ncbi:30S ribosomal protein S14 type Z [Candidatus Tiddalikarchaeum anstoanum]|nr:30S ribosomal protein S14 type Z [Candidatus Tiddalikarchaeum anstoanum]
MTAKFWKKSFKNSEHKPGKMARILKCNKPKVRKYGRGLRICSICLRRGAHIRRYGLHVCRQCFRDIALSIGFEKY